MTQVTVASHGVTVETANEEPGVVTITATCGETVRKRMHRLAPLHDRTLDDAKSAIAKDVQSLAEEAAGHENSRLLAQLVVQS